MIKNLVFDAGGVIIDLNKKPSIQIYNALSVLLKYPADELQDFFDKEGKGIIEGSESINSYLARVLVHFNITYPIDELADKLDKLCEKEPEIIDWDLLEYVKKLKKDGYTISILSDMFALGNSDRSSVIIRNSVDFCYFSFEQGTSKIDGSSFKKFIEITGYKANEDLFTDDLEVNINMAKEYGFNAFVYKGLEHYKEQLKRYTPNK